MKVFDSQFPENSLKDILKYGAIISSSGTSGPAKSITRTPENLKNSIRVAIDAQRISKKSKILTVTRMTHAGGLLTQTLPAVALGCEYKIEKFNAYTFLKDFENYTHTFLTPAHMTALMNTKGFDTCNLKGKWILGGSEPVTYQLLHAFVSKGATVQPNWGMSEIGPITINQVFTSLDEVESVKNEEGTILGNKFFCDWKILNSELVVKGDTCIYDSWYSTGDLVYEKNGSLFYTGRLGIAVDFKLPKKD